jgi:cell division transport system permease protein
VNPCNSRLAALGLALRQTFGRPFAFALVLAASAGVLAAVVLGSLLAWRTAPWEAPAWMQAEALVLVAGAEGEVDLAAVRASLRQVPAVAAAEFIGRDAALRDLAQRKALAGTGLAELRPNPLPDGFRVRFVPGAGPEQVEAAVEALRKLRHVDAVEFQPELLRRAAALAQLVQRIAWLLAGLAAAALLAALLVAVTFWSGLDAAEVRVLHRLGAEVGVIVRPAAYAAGISLLAAALLAWWWVAAASTWIEPALAELAQHWGLHWAPLALPPGSAALLCGAAGLLGWLLAALVLRWTVRRQLRAAD